jgi:hypothetical protein
MGERRRGYLLRLGGCGKNGNKRDENEPFLLLVVGVNSVVVFLCLFAWLLVPVLLRRGIYSTPQVGVRARWRVWERRSRQKWERRKDKDTVLLLLLLHSPFAYVSCSCVCRERRLKKDRVSNPRPDIAETYTHAIEQSFWRLEN